MKATIEFDLTNEADSERFEMMMEGHLWKLVVMDIDEHLRREVKYQDKEHLREVREELISLIESYNLIP
jgi:hypothetical protein